MIVVKLKKIIHLLSTIVVNHGNEVAFFLSRLKFALNMFENRNHNYIKIHDTIFRVHL